VLPDWAERNVAVNNAAAQNFALTNRCLALKSLGCEFAGFIFAFLITKIPNSWQVERALVYLHRLVLGREYINPEMGAQGGERCERDLGA
jgi:hypothetical protein